MKEFEKWWKEKYPGRFLGYERHYEEDAWKAALEWIYSSLDYSEEHEEIKDIIEQELE